MINQQDFDEIAEQYDGQINQKAKFAVEEEASEAYKAMQEMGMLEKLDEKEEE